jgi:hypothetical protein
LSITLKLEVREGLLKLFGRRIPNSCKDMKLEEFSVIQLDQVFNKVEEGKVNGSTVLSLIIGLTNFINLAYT